MISNNILNQFPRSKKYPFQWMGKNEMGPNSVWLTEFLSEKMKFNSNDRILDLGCGKACSSIFLAKEFGVNVWATDLWIDATTNFHNIRKMNMEDSVFPVYSDARSLPYANEYFDAITCIDAYAYFGTDDYYLSTILQFLKPGGQLGIITPGLTKEVDEEIIFHYGDLWDSEMICFHSLEWWQNHWKKTGLVEIINAEPLPNVWQMWLEWESELESLNLINPEKGSDLEFIKRDNGKFIQFFRLVAKKK